eukprot:COSAG02_NODE_59541_length_274_cov_0.582857_1_plen_85_part_01
MSQLAVPGNAQVQALFGMEALELQRPLMFVNMFGACALPQPQPSSGMKHKNCCENELCLTIVLLLHTTDCAVCCDYLIVAHTQGS